MYRLIDQVRDWGRNVVRRWTYQDADHWRRWGWSDGKASDSGIRVGRDTALTCRVVWQCVSLIADDLAKTPIHFYRINAQGNKRRDKSADVQYLVARKPNPFQTSFHFWRDLYVDALLGHGGYAYIDRDPTTYRPRQLIRLLPDRVKLDAIEDRYGTLDRSIIYMQPSGKMVEFDDSDIIRIRGLSYDSHSGYDITQFARNSFGYSLGLEKFGNKFFGNGAKPSYILSTDKRLDKQQIELLHSEIQKMQGGLDNAHRVAILQQGLSAQTLTIDPRNSQLIEARSWSVPDVCGWFKIPPNRVGAEIATSYASLEQEDTRYVTGTLDPWMCQTEQELNDKLLTTNEAKNHTREFEYQRNALIRADIKTRYEAYSIGLSGHPFLSPNEVRKLENMPDMDDMDDLQVPTNNFGEQQPEELPASQPDDSEPNNSVGDADEAARVIYQQTIQRCVERLAKDASNQSKSGSKFLRWLDDDCEGKHRDVIAKNMDPVLALRGIKCTGEAFAMMLIGEIRAQGNRVADAATNDNDLHDWVTTEAETWTEKWTSDKLWESETWQLT